MDDGECRQWQDEWFGSETDYTVFWWEQIELWCLRDLKGKYSQDCRESVGLWYLLGSICIELGLLTVQMISCAVTIENILVMANDLWIRLHINWASWLTASSIWPSCMAHSINSFRLVVTCNVLWLKHLLWKKCRHCLSWHIASRVQYIGLLSLEAL